MVGLWRNSTQAGRAPRILMVLLVSLIPLSLGWALAWPLKHEPPANSKRIQQPRGAATSTSSSEGVNEQELGALLQRKLRHDLEASVVGTASRRIAQKVVVPGGLQLLVTLVESDQRAALFSLSDGALQWCRVGDIIRQGTPWEVVDIQPATVVVRYLGQESVLRIPDARAG